MTPPFNREKVQSTVRKDADTVHSLKSEILGHNGQQIWIFFQVTLSIFAFWAKNVRQSECPHFKNVQCFIICRDPTLHFPRLKCCVSVRFMWALKTSKKERDEIVFCFDPRERFSFP